MFKELELLKGFLFSRLNNVPSKLNLNITSLCNSQCRTCNIWTTYRQQPQKAQEELTQDEIQRLLSAPDLNIEWLTIAGGEPFLKNNFDNILRFVVGQCPSIKLLSIPSNGLDKKRILQCLAPVKDQKKLLLYLTFSIDGPPDIHNYVRGVENGYEKTWETYSEVKKLVAGNSNFRIALETTISKFNIDHIEPFIKNLIAGGHTLILAMAHNAYQYKNEEESLLLFHESKDRIKEIILNVAGNIRGLSPEKVLKRVYLKNCVQHVENPEKHILPCTALQNSIVVDPYGNVFPCTMWNKKIGNIREHDYNLMALWNTGGRRQVRQEIKNRQCPACWTPCEAYQSIAQNFYRPSVLKNIW
jgi:MoaA/NifB/PqqE/SkfB family radical SAM enzyme